MHSKEAGRKLEAFVIACIACGFLTSMECCNSWSSI